MEERFVVGLSRQNRLPTNMNEDETKFITRALLSEVYIHAHRKSQ